MEEPGGRRETFVAALRKSEEGKGRPDGAKSVEELGGGRRETL